MWGYNFYITQFGRITDFMPLTIPGETLIDGTDYRFSIDDRFEPLYLVNNITQQQQVISQLTLSSQGFTLVEQDDRLLLLYRQFSGGTDGAFIYTVYDITGNQPVLIGGGSACSNPRLSDDSLEFYEVPLRCDFFPFLRGVSTWHMPLGGES